MAIVVISYRQTVRAYPDGGGAFIVANDNLGLYPAMVAAASLLTDYVLTVAVSISAGMAAITSAVPALVPYRVQLALGFLLLLTMANLRGVREASTLFAAPTYVFILIVLVTLAMGFGRCLGGACPQAVSAGAETAAAGRRGVGVPAAARLRLRGQCPHRDRGHRQRGAGLPPAQGAQRGHDAAADGGPGHHHVPGDQHPGPASSTCA